MLRIIFAIAFIAISATAIAKPKANPTDDFVYRLGVFYGASTKAKDCLATKIGKENKEALEKLVILREISATRHGAETEFLRGYGVGKEKFSNAEIGDDNITMYCAMLVKTAKDMFDTSGAKKWDF